MAYVSFKAGLLAVLLAFAGLFTLTSTTRAEVVDVHLTARPATVKIDDGVKLRAWTFNGTVPGPVIRATEGDTVRVTLTNSHKGMHMKCRGKKGKALVRCQRFNFLHEAMMHSIDFHAARIAPNVAFRNVAPGESFTFEFVAGTPGVYMYHCATGPMLHHLGMGMYGMIVVDPATPRPPAQEVFLVQSEFYGKVKGGYLHSSYEAMQSGTPAMVVFNGRSYRYALNPIQVGVGEPVRIFFLDAGPSLFSAFHVVGTIFDSYEHDGIPDEAIHDVSTQVIAPGGAGVFELSFPEAGSYPFVSHSVIDMDRGAMGMFEAS
ncbi:MAG TPA: multicopper oxidase domain-containing protein [Solirubrobacterales bacterium]|nr:multicopper oxidase domain-containing protein [Solirubrobacterales bacterium]HNC94029.1 multicopper oxidase domain-containing protein [Solirubrobacterales bacterium]HNE78179.1 multicopper oxidase domain-containing protein [Solirubrobacterales bacterium]HNG57035.1 multicopper oxidase domain-containing protein [Solirubrobacterales bacterium]HNI40977.1 multicopper oxidase domain-containing protein [Solirubrobacterales bacterium]